MAGPNADNTEAGPKPSGWKRWGWLALLLPVGMVIALLEPDEDDLFELCSTRGFPTIYRAVEAEGYYDGASEDCWGCWRYLKNTDYRFIEFNIEHVSGHRRRGPLAGPGIYRVTRRPEGSGQCDDNFTTYYKKTRLDREELESRHWCLQLERLDSRKARYGYYTEYLGKVSSSPITGSSISATRIFYLDHMTNQVLADSTDFHLTSFPLFHVSSFTTQRVCNDFASDLGIRGLNRQEVIRPDKEE